MSGIEKVTLIKLKASDRFRNAVMCVYFKIDNKENDGIAKNMIKLSKKYKKVVFFCVEAGVGDNLYGTVVKNNSTIVLVKDCTFSIAIDGWQQTEIEEKLKKLTKT